MISLLVRRYPQWLQGRGRCRGDRFMTFSSSFPMGRNAMSSVRRVDSALAFFLGLRATHCISQGREAPHAPRRMALCASSPQGISGCQNGWWTASLDSLCRQGVRIPCLGPDRKVNQLSPRSAFHAAPCHTSSAALTAARALCVQVAEIHPSTIEGIFEH